MENWRRLFKHTSSNPTNVQLVTASEKDEVREYSVVGKGEQLDQVGQIFWFMQHLGQIGASRTFQISVDGDGAARLEFNRIDRDAELKELNNMDEDLDKIHIGIE